MQGLIDIHSHIIPGIDDGCRDLTETVASIHRLKAMGYVGSICTPHIWPDRYPDNTPAHIRGWVARLQDKLAEHSIDYQLWAGGELRLFEGLPDWLEAHGVPTLAASRCVLFDFWDGDWPSYIDEGLDYLFERGYTPVMAHPERSVTHDTSFFDKLDAFTERGGLLQGNFRPMTGEDGRIADQTVRRLLDENRYTFMALDMHRPNTLQARFDGLAMVAQAYGQAAIQTFTQAAPAKHIFGESA